MTQANTADSQQTKLLLAVPLLFIPFCALFFWALGGGKGPGKVVEEPVAKGLNSFLPSPQLTEKSEDKMAAYLQIDKDSALTNKHRRLNLFEREMNFDFGDEHPEGYDPSADLAGAEAAPFSATSSSKTKPTPSLKKEAPVDELETKLTTLQRMLREQPAPAQKPKDRIDENATVTQSTLRELESTVAAINGATVGSSAPDPELGQMSNMLDKILDIQHPARVRDRIDQKKEQSDKGLRIRPPAGPSAIDNVLEPSPSLTHNVSALTVRDRPQVATTNGFFELNSNSAEMSAVGASVAAVVHETQTLVSGGSLKVRLEQDIFIGQQLIPKGSFVFGAATLAGERLVVQFSSIRYGQQIFPVSLSAYGLDGIAGIRIPGSITKEAVQQGSDQAIQALGISSLDPSLAAQAASAGISAARTLLSKKVRLISVTVKSDYPLLLKDDRSQQ